jgi:hypothetical protein
VEVSGAAQSALEERALSVREREEAQTLLREGAELERLALRQIKARRPLIAAPGLRRWRWRMLAHSPADVAECAGGTLVVFGSRVAVPAARSRRRLGATFR